jgi:rhodanese-related sulfurtransferase
MFLKKLFGFGPPPYAVLGAQEVADKLKSTNPVVIDVREPHEYSGGHIKGSKNIPLRQLPERVAQLGVKDREIILVCASGGRSSSAASYLVREGYTNICNLSGGMMSWRRAGLPIK